MVPAGPTHPRQLAHPVQPDSIRRLAHKARQPHPALPLEQARRLAQHRRTGGAGAFGGAGRNARGNYTVFQAEQPGVGNKAIALKNCRNVNLRDFSILKGGHFAILVTGVDNLTIDNLKIDTDRDGMDIDCCKNVRVSNCTVNSPWDDAIVPKSSFALGYNRTTENMNIANCYVAGCWELGSVLDGTWKRRPGAGGTGRIKCGTESNGGFINIAISNCVFEGCQGLALETVDGALLEDVAVTNITMRDIASCPIYLRLGARLRGPKGAAGTDQSTVVGTLRRVLLSNIVCHNSASRFGSNITGIPGYPVEDLKISDVFVECVGGGTPDQVKIEVPERENGYPEPGLLARCPHTASTSATSTGWRWATSRLRLSRPTPAPPSISTTCTAPTSSPSPRPARRPPSPSTNPPTCASCSAVPRRIPSRRNIRWFSA